MTTTAWQSWGSQDGTNNDATIGTGALDIYVSGRNGDDTADGTSSSTPLATVQAALARVSAYGILHHPVRIHVGRNLADAAYEYPNFVAPFMGPNGSLALIGDGAGQVGEDGFHELVASTASLGGSTGTNIVGVFPSTNFYIGKVVEVTSGIAAGFRRTISRNTTTGLTVSNIAGFIAGDTYRIVEPYATLNLVTTADGPHSMLCTGQAARLPAYGYGGNSIGLHNRPGFYLANFVVTDEGGSNGIATVENVHAVFYGVAFAGTTLNVGGAMVNGGCNTEGYTSAELDKIFGSSDVGSGTPLTWDGWGISSNADIVLEHGSVFVGMFTCGNLTVDTGANAACTASSVITASLPVLVQRAGRLSLTTCYVEGTGNSTVALRCMKNGFVEITTSTVSASSSGAASKAIVASSGGLVSFVSGTVVTANAGSCALGAIGGTVYFANGISHSGAGNFATCDDSNTFVAKASFTADDMGIISVVAASAGTPTAGMTGGRIIRGSAASSG